MKTEHAIRIAAPPEVVWEVTADVERWPEWTPTVKSLVRLDSGSLGPGSRVRIEQPGQPPAVWVVTALEPGRRFAWRTERPGLRMVATHDLISNGGGTENVLRLEAEGWIAALLGPVLRLAIRRALTRENEGLRARCEAVAATRSASR
jgi:uncharacterized protein YndB with AHSA1/START domain